MIVVLLVLSGFIPSGASAASPGPSPDPSPQPAPHASGPIAALPDPAPQATIRSAQTHVATPSQPSPPVASQPSSRVPTVATHVSAGGETIQAPVEPTRLAANSRATTQSRVATTSQPAPPRAVAANRRPAQSPPQRHRIAPRRRVVVHHAPVARRAPSQHVDLSFPLSFLPRDLLRLTPTVLRTAAPTHRNGELLLLSSLAMAGLAAASFAMFRRLLRLVAR